jgi:GGDEF domain-containing protein
MISLINLLLSIVRSITENLRESKKVGRERNEQLAVLLEKISECLEAIASEIRANGMPHEHCQELGHYLEKLPDVIGNRLKEEEADALMEYLRGADNAPMGWIAYQERIHRDLHPKSKLEKVLPKALFAKKREEQARQVAEVAGVFRGAANVLRAK